MITLTSTTDRPILLIENNKHDDGKNSEKQDNDAVDVSKICFEYDFEGYPILAKSLYDVGEGLKKANRTDLAQNAYRRGCEETGCVPCIRSYCVEIFTSTATQLNQVHLAFPWMMEGMIRGNITCVVYLIKCYMSAQTRTSSTAALIDYLSKIHGDKDLQQLRKVNKERITDRCVVCSKTEKDDGVTLEKCGGCSYYSYCSKSCQRYHWKEQSHCGECRQLEILRKYHKPHKRDIRNQIKNGQDPKTIAQLQLLRQKLGLTRSKEEYEPLVERLSNANNANTSTNSCCKNKNNKKKCNKKNKRKNKNSYCQFINPYEYAVARKDGTVHIGSTPDTI